MIAPLFITILIVPALLVMLLCVLVTHAYTQPVPQGQNALGLVPILFALVAASLALVIAALSSVIQGTPSWVAPGWPAPRVLALIMALGIALASIGTLFAWMERWGTWVAPLSLVTGVVGPVLLGSLLLTAAWRDTPLANQTLRHAASIVLTIIASAGYLMCVAAAAKAVARDRDNSERVHATKAREAAERSRKNALSAVKKLEEDYLQMSDDAPLWVFVASLPDETDQASRALTIARAQLVPDFDAQVASTLSDTHPRYRHGTLALILALPHDRLRAPWAAALHSAIQTTTSQIAASPAWLTPDAFSNPAPAEHLRELALAAAALDGGPETDTALRKLRDTIAAVTSNPDATHALGIFDQAWRKSH